VLPPKLGPAFLDWLRVATEHAWSGYEPRTFEEYESAGVGGDDWVTGTRWTGGLDAATLDAVEGRLGVPFGAQHRLFLSMLHATTPAKQGARFVDTERIVPVQRPGFYHWLDDADAIDEARVRVVDGLLFDVEHNQLWPADWGLRPDGADERRAVVRSLVAGAPPLLPLTGHRFAVGGLHGESGVVLSVHQSDIIVYGNDLRAFLINELGGLIGAEPLEPDSGRIGARIPFWGRFISGEWK
jgi:hypothetical protein